MFSNADQNFLISFPQPPHLASEGERTSRVYARVQVLRTRAHLHCKLRRYLKLSERENKWGFHPFGKLIGQKR